MSAVLLLRAFGQTHGAVGVHWVGREPPSSEHRVGLYVYLENAALAVAHQHQWQRAEQMTARLREKAYRDALTGLPNAVALEEQLAIHEATTPFSVLALDFDGMREANTALGYVEGGDVLIATVGRALENFAEGNEFAARMHTAGDEFAVLLPGADSEHASQRSRTIESALDLLAVPDSHRGLYHGASVGWATRTQNETVGQTLGRAIAAMQARKSERKNECP